MKQAEKIWKRRWRTVCGIILLQVFLCPLFATNLQLKDGGILIVNANSDLSPLCNHIISELIHSLPVEYKGMAISPENLNLAQVYDEMQMDTVRMNLFTKYENKIPALVISMGGTPGRLSQAELERRSVNSVYRKQLCGAHHRLLPKNGYSTWRTDTIAKYHKRAQCGFSICSLLYKGDNRFDVWADSRYE